MTLLLSLVDIEPTAVADYGGKATSLTALSRAGLPVPAGFVLPCSVYHQFLEESGLAEVIHFELGRKPFAEMRWEELWDCALRLRNRFLAASWSQRSERALAEELAAAFADRPVAVRSSAPGEDGSRHSFAGLHDSLLGVRGSAELLPAIRRVWASLWSDRALLYRQELELDPRQSGMAVLLMEQQPSRAAGILFTHSPVADNLGVIEAVHGQGQGLVDGSLEPDRWLLERESGRLVEHQAPGERLSSVLRHGEIVPEPLAEDRPPLTRGELESLWRMGMALENQFPGGVDCEWCLVQDRLLLLQARPITVDKPAPEDKRPWYLSLHPSRASLERLRSTIEQERLPAMARETAELAARNLDTLPAEKLAAEIAERQQRLNHWEEIYQREYIPMAHGIRLFGEAYNDRLQPRDPFEFTRLLAGSDLQALRRNRALQELAEQVRSDPAARAELQRSGQPPPRTELGKFWRRFLDEYGDPAWFAGEHALATLVLAYAEADFPSHSAAGADDLKERFLLSFPHEQQYDAEALLELGRAAYRLRDDDNIAFGAFLRELERARQVGRRRLAAGSLDSTEQRLLEDALAGATGSQMRGQPAPGTEKGPLAARQLVGQPAGAGSASGPARVIRRPEDLNTFRRGEILVCDAVDPTMTFVAPLAAGVVERRGGMLIHGAIIAREYGLPCVTGVPQVTELVRTGQQLTVDGWLGLVILDTEQEPKR